VRWGRTRSAAACASNCTNSTPRSRRAQPHSRTTRLYSNGPSIGDRTSPYLGQTLSLNDAWEAYYIRGDGKFTKGFATYSPAPGRPLRTDLLLRSAHVVELEPTGAGNIPGVPPDLAFYATEFDQVYGSADMRALRARYRRVPFFQPHPRARNLRHENSTATAGHAGGAVLCRVGHRQPAQFDRRDAL